MAADSNQAPGIGTLAGRLVRTAYGAIQNRVELLALEWQEEQARLTELLVWAVGLVFLAMMGVMLLTATVIFLFSEEHRVYAAAGFAVLYIAGAIVAWFSLKSLLKREPFADSIDQARRDRQWLKSFD